MCFIERPVLAKLGFDRRTMPMKPMTVEQCVSEGLNELRENRSRIVPGRLNRFMDAFVPAFVKRTFTAKMLGKALANKHIVAKEFWGVPVSEAFLNRVKQLVAFVAGPESSYITGP